MSWWQLKNTVDFNRVERRSAEVTPPTACPFDGAILDAGRNGVLNCPLGNYRWQPGMPNPNAGVLPSG